MHRPCGTAARVLIAVLSVSIPTVSCGQAPDSAPQPPLFVDAWIGGPLDSLYNAEYARVQDVCQGQAVACNAAALDTLPQRLTPAFTSPDAPEPAGWLAVRLRARDRWPYASLLFIDEAGQQTDLIDDLGDWGYGTTLDVTGAREGWIQPRLLASVGGLWIGTGMERGFGIVDGPYGLEGRLWQLGPLPSGGPAGDPVVPEGVYMILSVDGATLRLRPEVPSDMDCGEPIDSLAESTAPPIYEVALADLFDASGRPVVEVAYGRGC